MTNPTKDPTREGAATIDTPADTPDRDAGAPLAVLGHGGCAGCRHHTKVTRPVVLGLDDEDQVGMEMESIAVDDERIENVYFCQHPDGRGREVGVGEESGIDCTLFEAPRAFRLSDDVLRALARRGL
jgi:hypothetical protein